MNNEIKREIILNHFQDPVNKEIAEGDNYKKYNSNNPNCIDNIDLYVRIDNDMIKDIKFMGEACAISTASTSIMIKNLIGKSIKDAKEYINNFLNMCNGEEYNDELLEEGISFSEIYKQTNRRNCVLLPYKGIEKAIDEYEKR